MARVDPEAVRDALLNRSAEAAALLRWASWSVDTLAYLCQIDDRAHGHSRELLGNHPDTLDIAHCRWASLTAITVADLCAAALEWLFDPVNSGLARAWSLRDITASGTVPLKKQARRSTLPPEALAWADGVAADLDYSVLLKARNPFVHNRHIRILQAATRPPGAHEYRTQWAVGPGNAKIDSRELVLVAHAASERWSQAIFSLVVVGRI